MQGKFKGKGMGKAMGNGTGLGGVKSQNALASIQKKKLKFFKNIKALPGAAAPTLAGDPRAVRGWCLVTMQ